MKNPWAWVVGLVVLVAASPNLVCFLRALVVPVVVGGLVVAGVRLVFHYTRPPW